MDVLSEVLKVVKLKGAMYFNGEFSAPWSILSPPASKMAPYLAPGAEHVIIYHLLTEGQAFFRTEEGERITARAGDVIVFPHGDRHWIENGSAKTVDNSDHLDAVFAKGLKLWRVGGGGEVTRFVCGFMTCEPRLCDMLLGGLPRFFKVNIRDDASGRWLENSIKFSVSQGAVDRDRPGGEAVMAKLAEVLFVETLRAYLSELPAQQTGWLAGARDPEVGKTLMLMHQKPCRPWTIASLAKEAGLSRSVLAERFRHYLGEPPMAYLTKWRINLGSRMLTSTSYSVAQIAAEVGYESEAAFNRAFKREFGSPPARYRSKVREAEAKRRPALTLVPVGA
jgi:AraC-like DNA-binding protein